MRQVPGTLARIGELVFVQRPSDFPAAVAGVRTLESGTAYFLTGDIDLAGDRLANTEGAAAILGTSSETASLTSAGLGAGVALITATKTLRLQNITIKDVGTGVDIDGDSTLALDWDAVNFRDVTAVGEIGTVGNFILTDSAFLSSQGLRVTGTLGTLGISDSLLQGDGTTADDVLEIAATATITRRFRVQTSSVIASGSTSGLNVSASATIPDESYILDTVNFSGGGTYLTGLDYTSNKALFSKCDGVVNTAVVGNYYMRNNATATTIATINTPVKVAGTTTANSLNQKFSHSSNRLTYDGAFEDTFRAQAVATVTGSANKVFGFYGAVNGVVDSNSEMYATTNAGGRAESIVIQGVFTLAPGDYIEVWIENTTDTSNLTVEFLNLIVERAAP